MNLDSLSEEQLEHIVNVVAKDLKFKSAVVSEIYEQENVLKKLLSRPSEIPKRGVSLNLLQIFHRPAVCVRCGYVIYPKELSNKFCKLCYQLRSRYLFRTVEISWKVFGLICPFNECQFGYAKLACTDFREVDWTLRAKIEMHISYLLKVDIDQASVLDIANEVSLKDERQNAIQFCASEDFRLFPDLYQRCIDSNDRNGLILKIFCP